MKIKLILLSFLLSLSSLADIVALFDLAKFFPEGHGEPGFEEIFDPENKPTTFMSLITRLRRAAKDKNVKACVFYGEITGLGLAQSQELHRHIHSLKKAGKETYFYARSVSNANILPLSAADKAVLFPTAEIFFNGFHSQGMYFKKMLTKVGLEADIIHIGDFKTAGEPFYQDAPSRESQQQSEKLYKLIFERFLTDISENRKISVNKIKELISKAVFDAETAKQFKLIDEIATHKDFVDHLKKKYQGAKFTAKYGLPKSDKLQLNNIMDVFAFFNKLSMPPPVDNFDKISLTVVDGVIEGVMGEKLRRHILKQAKDQTVKAMVLRINSPGGSALTSEVICQALMEFKKSGKPILASFSNVAASGGYYIAMPADKIYAEEMTITGSIGVVGGKMVMGGLLDKIGISTHDFKIGPHADMMSMTRKFSEAEKDILIKAFERTYSTFKKRVSEGRKNKIKGDLEQLAGGRVYTGTEALKLGLVDNLGGLRDTISETVKIANLKKYKIVMYPRQMNIMDLLSKELQDKKEDEYLYSSTAKSLVSEILKKQRLIQEMKKLAAKNPQLFKKFTTLVSFLDLLNSDNVLLAAPEFSF